MTYIKFSIFSIFNLFVFISCNNCKKKPLNNDQLNWVKHFTKGEVFIYENQKGITDTLEVIDTSRYFTECNQFELSKYQSEIYMVRFRFMSGNNYNENESNISVTAEPWQKPTPYLYFGNLGPHRNDLENDVIIPIDTSINGIKLNIVYYYSQLNTEEYGEIKYFKNCFWKKDMGLIAYTTFSGDFFILKSFNR